MIRYLLIPVCLIGWMALVVSPALALTSQTLFKSDMSNQDNASQPRTVTPKQALNEQEQIFRGVLSCWKTLAQSYTDPGFQNQPAQQKASVLRQEIHDFYQCIPGGSSFQFGSRGTKGLGNFASGSDTEFLIRLSTVHIEEKPASKKSSDEAEAESKESEASQSETKQSSDQNASTEGEQPSGKESSGSSGGSSNKNDSTNNQNSQESDQTPSEGANGYNDSGDLPDT